MSDRMTKCYVIESHNGLYVGESVLSPTFRRIGWVSDFNKAFRFADQGSAESFVRAARNVLNVEPSVMKGVTEHMFESSETEPSSEQ